MLTTHSLFTPATNVPTAQGFSSRNFQHFLLTVPLQHGALWMTSSKEILLFRRTLLKPVTSLQFQHFVALKGEFLENDVLFWLEVQKYKVRGQEW